MLCKFEEALFLIVRFFKHPVNWSHFALYKQALEIFEKSLGPDHLNVAETLENYALLLRKNGRDKEAGGLDPRAKAIRDKYQQEDPL